MKVGTAAITVSELGKMGDNSAKKWKKNATLSKSLGLLIGWCKSSGFLKLKWSFRQYTSTLPETLVEEASDDWRKQEILVDVVSQLKTHTEPLARLQLTRDIHLSPLPHAATRTQTQHSSLHFQRKPKQALSWLPSFPNQALQADSIPLATVAKGKFLSQGPLRELTNTRAHAHTHSLF